MERDDEYKQIWNRLTPAEIAEYLKVMLPDLGDLDAQELLLLQESACDHYMKSNKQKFGHGQSSSFHESSSYMESQMDHDEALARALEMEDHGFDNLHISHSHDNARSNVTESNVEASVEQDGIDPDTMTYEQLQSLGDEVGHESKGLSKELMSRLPTSIYKRGSSNKTEECVICCVEFKKGVEVTNLPCAHSYHSNCITKWLELKKHCPVCQNEVQQE